MPHRPVAPPTTPVCRCMPPYAQRCHGLARRLRTASALSGVKADGSALPLRGACSAVAR